MINRASFFAGVRSSGVLGRRLTKGQVVGVEAILDAFERYGDGSRKTLAYALATARREVGPKMLPVREGFKATDAQARAFVAALARKNPGRYLYAKPVGGHVYYGRGVVQLTWRDNYAASSRDAGVDLVEDPDRALDPLIACKLLILGLIDGRWNGRGKGIGFYLPEDGPDDLMNARRVVNLTDHWEEVAGNYQQFLDAIDAAGGVTTEPPPKPTPVPAPVPPEAPDGPEAAEALRGLLAWYADRPDNFENIIAWLKRMPT